MAATTEHTWGVHASEKSQKLETQAAAFVIDTDKALATVCVWRRPP